MPKIGVKIDLEKGKLALLVCTKKLVAGWSIWSGRRQPLGFPKYFKGYAVAINL